MSITYEEEMLLRARHIVAAKEAVADFMSGPGGLMLSPAAFNDIARALGHLMVRYNEAKTEQEKADATSNNR